MRTPPSSFPPLIVVIAAILVLAGCEVGPGAAPGTDGDSAPAAPGADSVLTAPPTDASPAPEQDPQATRAADLRAALEERLRGPSTEAEAGAADDARSILTAETADALRSVTVDSAGHATVDFHDLRPLIPNASSSAGSTLLLNELNATVFGLPEIRSVEYRMEGSCDLFWEWLQYGCHTVTRGTTSSGLR